MQSLSQIQMLNLALFVFSLGLGQVLFKKVAMAVPGNIFGSAIFQLVQSPWFWLALTLYGFSTLLWIHILQRVSLSIAYPFVALAFVIVPIADWLIYGAQLDGRYFAGAVLLVAGILVINLPHP